MHAWVDCHSCSMRLPGCSFAQLHDAAESMSTAASMCAVSSRDSKGSHVRCAAHAFGKLLDRSQLLPQPQKDVVHLFGLWTEAFFQEADSEAEEVIMSWLGDLLMANKA